MSVLSVTFPYSDRNFSVTLPSLCRTFYRACLIVRILRPHLKQRNKLQRPALLPKTCPYTRASGKLDVPWLKSGTQEVQQEVERFHRDQLLQLRSDKNWQSQRTEKREKTLHVFAVSLTQQGRGMVRYNSSNLATLRERSGAFQRWQAA